MNILVLHPLLDQVISYSLENFHNPNPNRFYFIDRYAIAAHILDVSYTFLFLCIPP